MNNNFSTSPARLAPAAPAHTFIFPLTSAFGMSPRYFETSDLCDGNEKTLFFRDDKTAKIVITTVFELEGETDRLIEQFVIDGCGNAIVTDGNEWYQIAYKLTCTRK